MASSDILSQTLHTITSVKLSQLDKQKASYESGKRALLDDAAYETNHRKRARLLVERSEKLPAMNSLGDSSLVSVDNLKRFVQQADYDPCISEDLLSDYENAMRNELDVQSAKYRYAELYGKLVNEWISAGKVADQGSESGFVPVGREEMHRQRATWEQYVFQAKETDGRGIKSYLERLFVASSKDIERAFGALKGRIGEFQRGWDKKTHFDEDSLKNTIRGLLRTDILTDQKRTTLNDFLRNEVRNRRRPQHADADPPDLGLGRPDLGRRDARGSRLVSQSPGVDKDAAKRMSKEEARRRRFFLGNATPVECPESVVKQLSQHYETEVLLDQLPESVGEKRGGYGSDGKQEADDTRKSHVAVVQNLLHLIQSDIIMEKRLGNDVTVIRSDLKWFGPSVPHSSIFAVLEFFGVSAEWIDLFRRVLECPFASPRTRRTLPPTSEGEARP
ncbi:LOW QUALITY PROTEIN: hypothetical protein Ct61P_02778 [Colletotrichum tofieldiae]|nr:LOW QUALITY PROTEIN: hypothetical protein Ct61P_02778 [Colletotrichum tofieldiae]